MILSAGMAGMLVLSQAGGAVDVFELNKRLNPGINYGNVLEASPPEGWGGKLDVTEFPLLAAAGFHSLRLPVRWSAMAAEKKPYAVDPLFMAKVDGAVQAALKAGLLVVLDMHHYEEIFKDPDGHQERFLAIWSQIASHFAAFPPELLFEPLNEPHDKLGGEIWNQMLQDVVTLIRKTNPTRALVVDPGEWGGVGGLYKLSLPEPGKNLILSFHNYAPFEFTHQGAEWVGAQSQAWLGHKWNGSEDELKTMKGDFDKAAGFGKRFGIPVYMGEFGAYNKADMDSRVRWTAAMAKMVRDYGFSSAYWEFKSGFGIYDASSKTWNDALRKALTEAAP